MRSHWTDLRESGLLIAIYTAVGAGALFAASIPADGFFDPEDAGSLAAQSPLIFWLAIVIIGYFLGWTLSGLAVDYEPFWRLPGRTLAFARLAAEAGTGPLRSAAQRPSGVADALRYRALRRRGIEVAAAAPLTFVYIYVRGAWLGAALASAALAVEVVRAAAAQELSAAPVGGLAASLLALGCASVLTVRLGPPAARQAAAAIQAAHDRARAA